MRKTSRHTCGLKSDRRPRGFAARVLAWQRVEGRRDLPWQGTRDPYRVWLSEIMLQQTQVATVIPYYERFLREYPDVFRLAAAPLADVLSTWAGLGYYSRARNLHACARHLVDDHGGVFPCSAELLVKLPGIGRSTAAAIAAFCFEERTAILDGNVKRVLARHFGVCGDPGAAPIERELWELARSLLPAAERMPAYTQGLMDLGATLCTRTRPACAACPLRHSCVAARDGRTEELPWRRPVRSVRVRTAHWLVLVHEQQVFLEQRPPTGLWGGLLAPPQFDDDQALCSYLTRMAGVDVRQPLPQRRHAFTHFTLMFTPHVARLAAPVPNAAEAAGRWLPLAEVERAPLPSPVRALLCDVRDGKISARSSTPGS